MSSYGGVQGRSRYRLANCRVCVLYLARARARARADGRPGPPRKRWGAGPPLQPLARRKLGARGGRFCVRLCARVCRQGPVLLEKFSYPSLWPSCRDSGVLGLKSEIWGSFHIVILKIGDVFGMLPHISAKMQRWRLRISSCRTMRVAPSFPSFSSTVSRDLEL